MAIKNVTREQASSSSIYLAQLSKRSAMPVKSTTKLGSGKSYRNSTNRMIKSKITTLLLWYMSLHLEKAKAQGKFWKSRLHERLTLSQFYRPIAQSLIAYLLD